MGPFAILMFAAFGLIPLTSVVLAVEWWGRANLVPWVFAWSPWTIRMVQTLPPVPPRIRDGRILRGDRISLRLLPDGQCFFVPKHGREGLLACGKIHWPGGGAHAEIKGQVSLGSLLALLSVVVYGLFALVVQLSTAGSDTALLLWLLAGVAGLGLAGLGVTYAIRGVRVRLEDDVEAAELLLKIDARFATGALSRSEGSEK